VNLERLTGAGGIMLLAGGILLIVAAVASIGPPLTWNAADAFAARSLLPRSPRSPA
jgi:hypothetical protein